MGLLVITQKIDANDDNLGFFHDWIVELSKHFNFTWGLCLEEGSHSLGNNVEVISLGKEIKKSRVRYVYRFYKTLIPLIMKKKIDRIFIHMNEIYVYLLIPLIPFLKINGVRLLWWKARGQIGLPARLARFFVDKVVTSSSSGYPVKTSRKVVIGQGIDTNIFVSTSIPESKMHNIIVVGRLSSVKHVEDMIYAADILIKKYKDLSISVVGATERDSEYLSHLLSLVKEGGLEGVLSFVPAVPHRELVALYRGANILVNTSDTDSMDKVVLEAMASGVIPVSSNAAYRDMLEPFNLWVPKRDISALANTIDNVFSMDLLEKNKTLADLRDIVESGHSLSNLARKIATL